MAEFRTDYKDQLLDSSVNTKRKYDLVDESGNVVAQNVSLEDKTAYSQNGDTFGAAEVNKIHEELNGLNESLTAENNQTFQFAYDSESGKYGYKAKVEGADTFFPFKSASKLTISELRFRQLQPGDWSWFTLNTENFNNLYIGHARCDNSRAHLYIGGSEYGMPTSNLNVDISTVNSVTIKVDAPTNADVTYITNIVLSE